MPRSEKKGIFFLSCNTKTIHVTLKAASIFCMYTNIPFGVQQQQRVHLFFC